MNRQQILNLFLYHSQYPLYIYHYTFQVLMCSYCIASVSQKPHHPEGSACIYVSKIWKLLNVHNELQCKLAVQLTDSHIHYLMLYCKHNGDLHGASFLLSCLTFYVILYLWISELYMVEDLKFENYLYVL